ncbi:MAG: low specificity L-threonine aldolase [Clostridia bacterium]|nr:low specificity L-threonine aldolase [Clostridia bacterium]
MLSFENDYSEGAHPALLRALAETSPIQQPGYGEDAFCQSAKEKIRAACESLDADVFFLVGGTQANQVIIDALLSGVEGVVSAVTGHVNCHEAGAIEYTGHKVIPLPQYAGKMRAADLDALLRDFYADPSHSHMAYPGAVYISHPTEYGTLYTLDELKALRAVCDAWKLPLFLDGARLGYGLMSDGSDVTLPDIARLCDVFYIGGTKVGALCGEAVVFPRHGAPARFDTHIKQHGAMLAKGRLLGVQFNALFTDGLYFSISRHAIEMAGVLKRGLLERGCRFFLDSPTNQQFVILDNGFMERLAAEARFSFWGPYDASHSVVRLATSWATAEAQVRAFLDIWDRLA